MSQVVIASIDVLEPTSFVIDAILPPATVPAVDVVVSDPVEVVEIVAGVAASSAVAKIGDEPPASPALGQLWYESDTGKLFVWYGDVNSAQWVQTA